MNASSDSYDVVIAGAGPSGTMAALALKNSGLRVLLLDKSVFPREKICGDAVAAYVPKVLSSIDPQYAHRFMHESRKTVVDTCRISTPNGSQIDLKFKEEGFICERIHFDHLLLGWVKELENVTVIEGKNWFASKGSPTVFIFNLVMIR